MRPGSTLHTGPIANARISRQQILLTPLSNERVEVKNVGKAPMSINGVITVEGVLVDGDELAVHNAAIWLVRFVEREWSSSEAQSVSPGRGHQPAGLGAQA